MTPDYDRLPVCDEFDELVKTGKAEYVTGENGEVFMGDAFLAFISSPIEDDDQ